MLVEEFREGFALERFPFHDVTPMTGGISDAQKDRFPFGAGLGEGLFTPGIPINRIMLMLQEIGGFLSGEPIGVRASDRGGIGCHNSPQVGRSRLASGEIERHHKRQAFHGGEPHLSAAYARLVEPAKET